MIGEIMKLKYLSLDDASCGKVAYANPQVCNVLSTSIRDFAVLTLLKADSIVSKRSLQRMADQIKENEVLNKVDHLRQLFKKQNELFFRINQSFYDVRT
jgi:hypothetical protein